jgi:hypothetical protein
MRIKKNGRRFKKKEKYMKYGTIYGKKYCVKTDYGCGTASSRWKRWKSLSANTIKTQRRRDDDYVL